VSNPNPRAYEAPERADNSLRRGDLLFGLLAFVIAVLVTRGLIERPGYTDAYYHFNAAHRLVTGEGLTDPYLWTYIGAPASFPAPSHRYWMPLTSLIAAAGMAATGRASDYGAAQWPFTLLFAGTALVAYGLGLKLGGGRRYAWLAGLLALFSGFFTRFWGATDTFTPYALIGSLCLLAFAQATTHAISGPRTALGWMALGGVFAGLAHLTRADGVLLLLIGWGAWLWPVRKTGFSWRLGGLVAATLTYLLVMAPWFARNLALEGTPLPLGGTQGIWFTEYNDLFSYPADASVERFFSQGGIGLFLKTRWEAFSTNLMTFIAVEGMVFLTPLMLVGLWQRRTVPFLRPFWLYALGLHLAMTVIFPYPGMRGGLFHSAAALVPWWAALASVGLDDAIDWIASRRRRWRPATARRFFSVAMIVFALVFSLWIAARGRVDSSIPALYRALDAVLPEDARVMINDPAELYYFTGRGGVVLPNEPPETILEIARRYNVDYLLLEGPASMTKPLWALYDETPDFLEPLPFDAPDPVRLYAIKT